MSGNRARNTLMLTPLEARTHYRNDAGWWGAPPYSRSESDRLSRKLVISTSLDIYALAHRAQSIDCCCGRQWQTQRVSLGEPFSPPSLVDMVPVLNPNSYCHAMKP
ncbi:unnamed protein product [Mortierella alpina]